MSIFRTIKYLFLLLGCISFSVLQLAIAASGFQNNLLNADLAQSYSGGVNITLYTSKPYTDLVVVNKKNDYEYVILLPETSNSLFAKPDFKAASDIVKDIEVKTQQYDGNINGHHKKTLRSDFGNVKIDVPQDTQGEFEPTIVPKHSRDINPTINDAIISMYAKGMSTPDINSHLQRIYGIEISAETVSRITDKVLPIAKEWQNRPLDSVYPIIFLDGMVFNVAEDGSIRKKTAYVVYGVNVDGLKEILGIWLGEAESAKFWMLVLSELRDRGVEDILIASVDGLKGFSDAIKGIFPKTEVQRCIIHHIRNCTKYVVFKDRKSFCADMKPIYKAINEEQALEALEEFSDKWGKKYPYPIKSWNENWDELMTFMKYPEEIRRLIYTTNPIEAFNRGVRKITKTKTSFRTADSLFKLLYLVSQDISEKWTMPIHNWSLIFNQLVVYFEGRMC